MGKHKTIWSIVKVTCSNMLTLLSGIFVGLILPKIIGVTDYGYYKTFSLYISYIGLFHFGIEDGIYLKYGGKDLSELEEDKFHFYALFLVVVEGAISLITAGISCLWLKGDIRFIFIFVAIYLFTVNIGNFYQFISQITERFTELTIIGVVRSALTIISVGLLWLLSRFGGYSVNYKFYIVCTVTASTVILAIYTLIYRKLTFGKMVPWREGLCDIGSFIKNGLPLMVANLCSTLLLTIDRQFVNILFDTDTYAVYAFAYNLLTLITTATSAISVVLFPIIKRLDAKELPLNYSKTISIILVFVSACLFVYFPICPFIAWFLPQYTGALPVFRVILPGLVGTSAVTIIMHNYYKATDHNLRFFIISIIVLAVAIVADMASYLIFRTTISISIVSIFVILAWYVTAEHFFIKKFHVSWIRNLMYMLCCMGAFYGITEIPNVYIGFAVFVITFAALTVLFFFKEIKTFMRNRKQACIEATTKSKNEENGATRQDMESENTESSDAGDKSNQAGSEEIDAGAP